MNEMFEDDDLGIFGGAFDSEEFEGEAMRAAAEDMGDEFTPLGKSKFDKNLNKDELKADLERQNLNLPSDEEELSSIQNMMDKKKAHEKTFGAGSLNESMLQVLDADGNNIRRHALVVPTKGVDKKGRVLGFGDDGGGRLQIIVSWEWPIDMKYTNPEEMGKERLYPEEVVIANPKRMAEDMSKGDESSDSNHPDKYHFDMKSLYHWFNDALHQLNWYEPEVAAEVMEQAFERDYDYKRKMSEMKDLDKENELDLNSEEQEMDSIEEMRGLGSSVKNTGDRNVKQRDDHDHAPLTNLNESIKRLFENKVTKKQLRDFISEQAKQVAKKLRD
jgi:hypothetical protein